ncbi:MAG: hypothetical protein JWP91_3604 [Fibrobacteres bacterium]|nr:hypothetical protein [Fibrobacterota bacterium]
MIPKPSASRSLKRLSILACLALLPLLTARCTTEDKAAAEPVIQILSPKTGDSFKLGDTVKIITKSDYTRFTSGITINYSIDSAKSWQLIKSKVRKEGIQMDTLSWIQSEDSPDITAGPGVMLQVYDYTKKFPAKTGFFTFHN